MDIQLKNLQKKATLNLPQIQRIVKAILAYEHIKDANLSFAFVTNQKIKSLNQKFLGRSYQTDVLSFDLRENKKDILIGEIIISIEMAIKNAQSFGNDLNNELALYIVHGILHLLGFDDHRPSDIKRMRKKEQQLLKHLGRRINGIV